MVSFTRLAAGVILACSLNLLPASFSAEPALNTTTATAHPAAQVAIAPVKAPIHITLLHVNDVYQLSPFGEPKLGGLARLATLIKAAKHDNPNTLFIMSGDTISPSLASHLFRGKQMVDIWNQLGLDVAVLGNHEFDYGDAILKQRISESKFPWLAANVVSRKTGQPMEGLAAYVLKDMNGVKLGFMGLLTVDTAATSHPGPDVRFADPVETTGTTLPKMKQAGADVLIGVTHLSMSEDQRVAQHFPMQLALILGGHEHSLAQAVAGGTPILKMDSDAAKMSQVELYVDADTHTLQHLDWKVIPVDDKIADDPTIAANIAQYENKVNQSLGEVLGQSDVLLDAHQKLVRTHESAIGNFIADSFRTSMKADICIINSGGIRSNTNYGPGNITLKDVISILPFENPIVTIPVSGTAIKAALENGVSGILPSNEPGEFPVVSGLTFKYDLRLPVGERVSNVSIGSQPLNLNKTYTMATSHYILQGKDGYTMFKQPVAFHSASLNMDSELVAQAIHKQKRIAPKIDGRIQEIK